jgi:hypothetical protein
VRFERVPIFTRIADLPPLAGGAHVRLAVGAIDLFALTVDCRYAGSAGDALADSADLDPDYPLDAPEDALEGQAAVS